MHRQSGITFSQVLMVTAFVMCLCIGSFIFLPWFACACGGGSLKAASAQNNRQMALAAIMYGSDYDDRIPVTINGSLCRMQNVGDGKLTVNCPAPGTQDFPAKHAAGGERTDAWPTLLIPYVRNIGLFEDPQIFDPHHIWDNAPRLPADKDYDPEGRTSRNQNRFPGYGLNYMFLAPLRVPKEFRKEADAINYAVSESHRFVDADDPSGTVFFTESQRSPTDATRGFFVVNAPGMWKPFAEGKNGLVAFWAGTAGTGDWTKNACADYESPCRKPIIWRGFVYTGERGGCNASFLDGHVKHFHDSSLAAGTDFSTAKAGDDGSGAHLIDKSRYLWNLNNNYYGL